MIATVGAGLVAGLTLIIAIGAQNAYVLRQGLAREHIGLVVLICTLSDIALILAGVAGIGGILTRAPAVLDVVRWLGVAFLCWYGVTSLLRARRPEALRAGRDGVLASRRSVALRALALTWLNPHVYLDTVLLLGTLSSQHGPTGRWWFAVGACVASVLWFTGLGLGARRSHRLLSRPGTWRVLDVVIGVVMLLIALRLALG